MVLQFSLFAKPMFKVKPVSLALMILSFTETCVVKNILITHRCLTFKSEGEKQISQLGLFSLQKQQVRVTFLTAVPWDPHISFPLFSVSKELSVSGPSLFGSYQTRLFKTYPCVMGLAKLTHNGHGKAADGWQVAALFVY